jgi:hypothetical protein
MESPGVTALRFCTIAWSSTASVSGVPREKGLSGERDKQPVAQKKYERVAGVLEKLYSGTFWRFTTAFPNTTQKLL